MITTIETVVPRRTVFSVLLLSVGLNAAGQLLFKAASLAQADGTIVDMFFHLETWAGLVLYGLSAVAWLWVLSRAQLSYAYPVLALSFPMVVGLSAVLFGESVSLTRWVGTGLILVGVAYLART